VLSSLHGFEFEIPDLDYVQTMNCPLSTITLVDVTFVNLNNFSSEKIVRPCERRPILSFVVSRKLKHGQLQNCQMYQKYRVKIVSKFLQNTHSDSNFNRIYDYDYGMPGLRK